jgi:hypothetical protein
MPTPEPGYDTTLIRIGGTVGASIAGLAGETWDLDSRHHYSRDQPWSCDGKHYVMEQKGGSPSRLILETATWTAVKGKTGHFAACTETRWHPTQPTTMVGYNKSTNELVVFDALTNTLIKKIPVGFVFQSSNGGFMGEGSLSNDGSMVALGDEANNVVMIDIPRGRVAPVQKVDFIRSPGHRLGNITISPLSTPSGGKVVAKASDTPELVHIYKYGEDFQLVHHFESDLTLSHADVGVTPAGREVFCGGARDWYGAAGAFSKDNGRIAAIHLDNGEVKNISAGKNQLGGTKEAGDQHCSCRGPVGWMLATYVGPQEGTGRFGMELVAWKLDGSRECRRFGVTRTNETIGAAYRAEAHGVMRPDGNAVAFASNWQHSSSQSTNASETKDFVYTSTSTPPPEPTPPPVTYSWRPIAVEYAIVDSRGLLVHPDDIVEIMNSTVAPPV